VSFTFVCLVNLYIYLYITTNI